MSVKEVSDVTGLGWRTVKTADKNCIREQLKDIREQDPVMIGVDEVAYEKGHKYLTVVRDVQKGIVIWVGTGRKELTMDLFYASLGREKTKGIKAVVMDMWDPYIASTRKWTDAEIVFDKFHLAKKANECLDTIRRKEFKQADHDTRIDFKNKRFLILSREKNLPVDKKETLDQLLRQNQILYKAYLLKEQLLDIMDEKNVETAMDRLGTWKQNVQESTLKEFQSLIKTMDHYLYGIQNYFKHRITNAGSEGFNNKINLVKRRAYGFRDIEYFMLKILKICGGKTSP
jgi:transposase